LGGSVPRNRHFTMLRGDEESFSRNKLWVVQGRLIRTAAGNNVSRAACGDFI
jgi:hypothetical protein